MNRPENSSFKRLMHLKPGENQQPASNHQQYLEAPSEITVHGGEGHHFGSNPKLILSDRRRLSAL